MKRVLGQLKFAVAALGALGAFALLGCHAGGKITASTPASEPLAIVPIPTIAAPAKTPFYSNATSIEVSGLCQKGFTVYISGDAVGQQPCSTNSTYTFNVQKSTDGVYSFFINQKNETSVSNPILLVWVKKGSVAPPVIVTPSTKPYLSGEAALLISGSCESGATISLSGDGAGSTVCVASMFALSLPKAADGNYDIIVTQTDTAGNSSSVNVLWHKKNLTVSPATTTIPVMTSQPLTFSGGSGVYNVTIPTNNSGGSFNSVTGAYVTGPVANVTDTIRISDTAGSFIEAFITTQAGLPDHIDLPAMSGDGQTVLYGQMLTLPMRAMVVDRYGNGLPNYPLVFQVATGDAIITTNPEQTSNASGIVQASVRMGFSSALIGVRVSPASGALPDLANSGRATATLFASAMGGGSGAFGATFRTGQNPGQIVTADFDGDGLRDAAVLNTGDSSVGFFKGRGTGVLANMVRIGGICIGPSGLAQGDFNADNRVDLVVVCASTDRYSILLGRGDGTFNPAVNTPLSANEIAPQNVVVADFDGDNRLDLAISNTGGSIVSVRFGLGNGAFSGPVEYTVGQAPTALAVADFNKDGRPDLVVANTGDNTASVLMNLNNGTGGFAAPVTLFNMNAPSAIVVADFNSDTWPDVAILSPGSNETFVFRNIAQTQPAILFDSPEQVAVGGSPTSLTAGLFDDDAFIDLAVTSSDDNNVSYLLGQNNFQFIAQTAIPTSIGPLFITSADMNGDNRPDLLVSTVANQEVQIIPFQAGGVAGFKTSVGLNPAGSATGDFDGDGKYDLVVVNGSGNSYSILKGDGKGLFTAQAPVAVGLNPTSVKVADFNKDGHMDFVVTVQTASQAKVFLGKGDLTFHPSVDYPVSAGPVDSVIRDFNNDGRLDIAVASQSSSKVALLLGNGNGTFQNRVDFDSGSAPVGIDAGDFNGDGLVDIATVNNSSGSVSILISNGNGTFQTQVEYATASGPNSLTVNDFNNDSVRDIAAVNSIEGTVSILLGNGDGSFRAKEDYSAGGTPQGIVSGDFNSDNRIDLAVGNGTSQGFTILLGSSTGQFNNSTPYYINAGVSTISLGEFNGDGALDLVVLDTLSDAVQLWVGH